MKQAVAVVFAVFGAAAIGTAPSATAESGPPNGDTGHSAPAPAVRDSPAVSPSELSAIISQREAALRAQLRALQTRAENIDVRHMFEMQLLINQLSQLSEFPPGLVSGANGGGASSARKGN